MAQGGRRRSDRKARPPSGPGRFSERSDLSAVQPARTPPVNASGSTLQYGDAARLEAAQEVAPIPNAPPLGGGGGPGGGGQAPGADLGPDLSLLAFPTQRPDEPVDADLGRPAVFTGPRALALKVDYLRYLATLPYASPEISQLLDEAQMELNEAQAAAVAPPPMVDRGFLPAPPAGPEIPMEDQLPGPSEASSPLEPPMPVGPVAEPATPAAPPTPVPTEEVV